VRKIIIALSKALAPVLNAFILLFAATLICELARGPIMMNMTLPLSNCRPLTRLLSPLPSLLIQSAPATSEIQRGMGEGGLTLAVTFPTPESAAYPSMEGPRPVPHMVTSCPRSLSLALQAASNMATTAPLKITNRPDAPPPAQSPSWA
jgi:hypothetical protein